MLDVDHLLDRAVLQMARALLDEDVDRALRWARIAGVLAEGEPPSAIHPKEPQ